MGPQEHRVERRLAAIFVADMAGYSRLMELDEVGTLHTLTAQRQITLPIPDCARTMGRERSGTYPFQN
jgi:hypothetical protein